MTKWVIFMSLLLLGTLGAEEKGRSISMFPIDGEGVNGISPANEKIYSGRLRELHEGSLIPLAEDEKSEVYRLTFVSYWDTHASVIKLTKQKNGYEIASVCPEKTESGEAPAKIKNQVMKLDAAAVDGFKKLLAQASFFKLPIKGEKAGDDGEDWILEAVENGKYHVAVRWSPGEEDPGVSSFLAACQWLREHNPDKEGQDLRFFPREGKNGISDFEEGWFSSHLRALQQQPLIPLTTNKEAEVYRLTILPTFTHPLAVIVNKKEGKYQITYLEEDGKGGYEPGKLIEHRTATLSPAEVKSFEKVFEASSFYTLDVADADAGLDGSNWILEAVKNGRYHVVVRWSPDSRPTHPLVAPFLATCNWLLEHAPAKK